MGYLSLLGHRKLTVPRVFGMLLLTLSGANVDFLDQELWWRTYTTEEVLPTTRHIELMDKKEFVAAKLDSEHKIHIVYVGSISFIISLSTSPLNVYPSRRLQIAGVITKEAPIKVSDKYVNFAFSPDLISKLCKHTRINDHIIKLVNSQQPPYGPIYSLDLIDHEDLH